MTDIWVCSTCQSINRQRDDQCYRCKSPQQQATGALASLRTEHAVLARTVVGYRSSLVFWFIAAAWIVAVAVLGVVVLNESLDAARYLRTQIPEILQTGVIDEVELARRSAGAVAPALAQTVSALAALLFFAAWLSRVIRNIPALGGGTPRATPAKAFIYPLIPVWNLFKTPPMLQEALYRLDPKAGGFFMILLAWVGLVGSWIVSYVVGVWTNLRILTVAGSASSLGDAIADIEAAYDLQVVVDIVTTLMVSAGAIVLVLVMFRIEVRARARDREIRAAVLGHGTAGPVPPIRTAATTGSRAAPPNGAPVAASAPAAERSRASIGRTVSATSLGASPTRPEPREPGPDDPINPPS